jgi:hypothetical protein
MGKQEQPPFFPIVVSMELVLDSSSRIVGYGIVFDVLEVLCRFVPAASAILEGR